MGGGEGAEEKMSTDTFPTEDGSILRIIDGQHHLGFYQNGIWGSGSILVGLSYA